MTENISGLSWLNRGGGLPYLEASRLRVRYSETDQMGIVYHANYLPWFEVGRTEFCRALGRVYSEWEAKGYLLPLSEAHCRYRSPARYDDVVVILCRAPLEEIKPHSVLFEYRVELEDGKLLAEGWTRHAFVRPDGRLYRHDNEFQRWLTDAIAPGDAQR